MKKVNCMNCKKGLNFKQLNFKAQWWAIFAIFGVILVFTACSNDDEIVGVEKYPSLKVVNETTDKQTITSVALVGYEFSNLSIPVGNSQIFALDKGMAGGNDDINIIVGFGYSSIKRYSSVKVNFNNGENTTIILKGCISYEGCKGYYLEYIQ